MTESDRPTLLLVHGAWHGAWAWGPFAEELRTRGWRVETVDLPSAAADDAARGGLREDADVVAAAIARIDGPVAVVAHSYGGMPATQAAVSDAVVRVIYVAAFALDVGESVLGAVGGVAPSWWHVEDDVVTAGTDVEPAEAVFFGDVTPDTVAWALSSLRPQSRRSFEEPLTQAAWREHPSTYVIATRDAAIPPAVQEALAARAGSHVVRLDTSHSPFLSQPSALADAVEATLA